MKGNKEGKGKNEEGMKEEKLEADSPGVRILPPFYYLMILLAGFGMQKLIPLDMGMFLYEGVKLAGYGFILVSLLIIFISLRLFYLSKNTVITFKAASSLQTTGIYRFTRNPMYVGETLFYLGLSCLIGNWWHIILFPLLILIVQEYIIRQEEKYLERRFGQVYVSYKSSVGRWF